MINKLKTFAKAILITGATVIATQAPATTVSHTHTNMVTLDNIQIALKVYTQGGLNSHDTALSAEATALTTTTILKELAAISGGAFTYANGDKLVNVTTYSNFVYGTAGTTNGTPAFSASLLLTNAATVAIDGATSTNLPDFVTATVTNSYVISNSVVNQIVNTGGVLMTNLAIATLTNDILFTNGAAFTNINTTPFNTTNGGTITSVVTITGVSNSATVTNITITEISPSTTSLFTNSGSSIAVLTPKVGSTAASLIPVDNWVFYAEDSGSVYAEAGKDLTTSNHNGTNITSKTAYGLAEIGINTVYPTNTPTGYMNVVVDAHGFSKSTAKLLNLTTGGNAASSQVFEILGSQVINVTFGDSGAYSFNFNNQNYIGGTFDSTNATTVVSGVTNNNQFVNQQFLGTNNYSGFDGSGNPQFISGSSNIVGTGTITVTYLSATTNITTDTNLP